MLDVFGFPSPQKANYQEFYGGGTVRDWVKPRGASMVRMLLIGAGSGGGGGTTGGGGSGGNSGNATQWIGPAIFIPDVLRISVGAGGGSSSNGGDTTIIYQQKDGTGYTLLTASGGLWGGTNSANANNFFGAAGIFKSIAGQSGAGSGSDLTASTTIFLSGGAPGGANNNANGNAVNCNYGYPTINGGAGGTGGDGRPGFFITQPIMLGVGGSGGGGKNTGSGAGTGGTGGIGCGGGGGGATTAGSSNGGRGGDGAVFIWSW